MTLEPSGIKQEDRSSRLDPSAYNARAVVPANEHPGSKSGDDADGSECEPYYISDDNEVARGTIPVI